jgi:hypothetical protein
MISALFYITGIVVALACMGACYSYYRRHQRIRRTETTRIADVKTGCYEIKGKILSMGPLLRSPLSGTACVFYDVAVVHGTRNRWFSKSRRVVQDKSHQPFGMQDDTGIAVIDLEGADYALNLDQKRRIRREKPADGTAPPAPEDRIPAAWEVDGEDGAICYETFLEEGDDLYVLGYVNRFDGDRPVFTSGACSILISDKSETRLLRHTLLYAAIYLLLSLVMILLIFLYYYMDQHPG